MYDYDPPTFPFAPVQPVSIDAPLQQWQVDDQQRYPLSAYVGEFDGWFYDGARYVPLYPPTHYQGEFPGWYWEGTRYMPVLTRVHPQAQPQPTYRGAQVAGFLLASLAMVGAARHFHHRRDPREYLSPYLPGYPTD